MKSRIILAATVCNVLTCILATPVTAQVHTRELRSRDGTEAPLQLDRLEQECRSLNVSIDPSLQFGGVPSSEIIVQNRVAIRDERLSPPREIQTFCRIREIADRQILPLLPPERRADSASGFLPETQLWGDQPAQEVFLDSCPTRVPSPMPRYGLGHDPNEQIRFRLRSREGYHLEVSCQTPGLEFPCDTLNLSQLQQMLGPQVKVSVNEARGARFCANRRAMDAYLEAQRTLERSRPAGVILSFEPRTPSAQEETPAAARAQDDSCTAGPLE
jgi:hypothetical protein